MRATRSKRKGMRKEYKLPKAISFDDDNEVTQAFVEDNDYGFAAVYTGSSSHIGTRDYQEDAFFVTEASSTKGNQPIKAFGIVCDGMGGLENGGKASILATDLMKEVFESIQTPERIEALLLEEIRKIDLRVKKEVGKGGGFNAGTTLVAAMILGKQLYWIGVGDSRVYVLRGEEIVQVTQDHNYEAQLRKSVEQGLISQKDADAHPQKAALTSFVGSGNIRFINTNKAGLDLLNGDMVLLCSDGLTKSLDDENIAEIMRTNFGDMQEAAKQLTLQSFDSGDGAKDNTTVVLMQYLT